ncbi:MAG: tRNA (adenosine(37)-N6)-threonylcarbamoyltransferase complex ATPase subunit type 1 TsaE [Sphaerochaetaceae bacterium]|nr:tRNA (adenosine(37)-N6)-threonylcarbamoyltransferase complex ATPase subunit type 1 TsaE [Sphaerochaetaceae bacterium]
MKSEIYLSHSEEATRAFGRRLVTLLPKGGIISLTGPLGSGKSVIAKGVAEGLKIEEAIVSPTFTLVQEYDGILPLTHLDLYRLDGVEDFEGIGGEELLYREGFVLIEWGEKIEQLLPSSTIEITLTIGTEGERKIELKGVSL